MKRAGRYVSKVVTFTGGGKHPWYWRMVGGNSKKLGPSEGYLRRHDRDVAARRLAEQLGVPVVAER